ncbi:hypothetical protein [Endozoicomonas sp.]|uniref:hypothetical protein n=1 Tax=Endozoicomonas sp. TaxID=1892382 RepID=UPI00383A2723
MQINCIIMAGSPVTRGRKPAGSSVAMARQTLGYRCLVIDGAPEVLKGVGFA